VIDTVITITCDGENDGDLCQAEFSIEDYTPAVNPLQVAHQLQQRGWRTAPGPRGVGVTALCPLHATRSEP